MNSPQQAGAPDERQGVLNKHKDRAKKMIRRGKDGSMPRDGQEPRRPGQNMQPRQQPTQGR